MRHLSKIAMVVLVGAAASGCIVTTDPAPAPGPGPAPAPAPTPAPALDAPQAMGFQRMLGYHVMANASSTLPSGDLGFVITANGNGGYRITWSDTLGSAAHFSGVATTDGSFDPSQVRYYSGYETIGISSDARTVTFESTPGQNVDGVDLVSTTDPIYLDVAVDRAHAGFSIYFTGAQTGSLISSSYDPVAFTSP